MARPSLLLLPLLLLAGGPQGLHLAPTRGKTNLVPSLSIGNLYLIFLQVNQTKLFAIAGGDKASAADGVHKASAADARSRGGRRPQLDANVFPFTIFFGTTSRYVDEYPEKAVYQMQKRQVETLKGAEFMTNTYPAIHNAVAARVRHDEEKDEESC